VQPKSETPVIETGCKSAPWMQYAYSFAVAMSTAIEHGPERIRARAMEA